MTTRRKIVVTLACLLGAAGAIAPIYLRFGHVGSNTRVEKAVGSYLQRTRHRSVRDLRCSSAHLEMPKGRYFCYFRYAGRNPFAIPKFLCVRLVANEAIRVDCFTP